MGNNFSTQQNGGKNIKKNLFNVCLQDIFYNSDENISNILSIKQIVKDTIKSLDDNEILEYYNLIQNDNQTNKKKMKKSLIEYYILKMKLISILKFSIDYLVKKNILVAKCSNVKSVNECVKYIDKFYTLLSALCIEDTKDIDVKGNISKKMYVIENDITFFELKKINKETLHLLNEISEKNL